jgi:hypothetical protein
MGVGGEEDEGMDGHAVKRLRLAYHAQDEVGEFG